MEKDTQDTNIVPFVTRGRVEMQIFAQMFDNMLGVEMTISKASTLSDHGESLSASLMVTQRHLAAHCLIRP